MLKNLIVILLVLLWGAHCDLIKERLKVIHHRNNNFLVRGNLPIKDNKFQYKALRKALNQLTSTENHELVVISLLNFLTAKETKNRYIEEHYFDKHSQVDGIKLTYENYFVLGSLIDPASVPLFVRSLVLKYYNYVSFDKLNTLMEKVEEYLDEQSEKIIYVHCSAGVDRTGYVGGAYKMKYLDKSLEEVVHENLLVLKGYRKHMHFNTFNGLQWYCLSLGRSEEECLIGKEANFMEDL